MKKLIPALALLLISAVLLSTASFAWFSMNTTVTVTGMQVNTSIKDSLSIASDTLDSTTTKAQSNFSNGMHRPVTGLLEPVSTINGIDYYYTSTSNVKPDGDAITDSYIEYDAEAAATAPGFENAFSQNYGVTTPTTAVGYVDYVFQLKAINTADTDKDVKMTRVNLLYNNIAAASDEIKAFRVAVFAKEIPSSAETPFAAGVAEGDLKTILKQSAAAYRTSTYAVSAIDEAPSEAVVNLNTAATIATVAPGSTKYYKVVVRMWIEGEDTKCNNETFLELTKNWTLDLELALGGGDDAVTAIGSVAGAVAEVETTPGSTNIAKVTLDGSGNLTNGEKPASYQWKLGDANIVGETEATYTRAAAASDVYCVVTTTRGSVYTTNTVRVGICSVSETLLELTNASPVASVKTYEDFEATYTADSGELPTDVIVTVDGKRLTKDTHYTWDISSGTSGILTIDGEFVTGSIAISAAATYTLTQTLNNVSSSVSDGPIPAKTAFAAKYTATSGTLPADVVITVNSGSPLDAGYTWNQLTGDLTIDAASIDGGDVEITITAE